MSGRVQMVMFRDFVNRKARKLKLTGFVENTQSGSVRIIAEGQLESLNKLVAHLREGSFLSRVDDVDISKVGATGEFTTFNIIY